MKTKTKVIQFRVNEEEYAKVKKCADDNDLTLSDAVRQIIADVAIEANYPTRTPSPLIR
ncbi:MAG: hypothetical protein AAB922_00160 [Patescibacteria group bacterium]